MPDGTYPNSKIIMCILQCIDQLAICYEDREKTNIERAIEIYKDGQPGVGYTECQNLAKQILHKWYRSREGIST